MQLIYSYTIYLHSLLSSLQIPLYSPFPPNSVSLSPRQLSRLSSASIDDLDSKTSSRSSSSGDFDALAATAAASAPNVPLFGSGLDLSSPAVRQALDAVFLLVTVGAIGYQLLTMHDTRGWAPSEIMLRLPVDTWDAYTLHLQQNPILTEALTSGTVYTIGDIISQRTERSNTNNNDDSEAIDGGTPTMELDRMRVLRSALAGLFGHGPLSHVWYNVCDFSFEQVLHLSAAWWPLKILVDQTIWGPIWNNTYIVLLGLMKGEQWSTIWSDMRRTTVPLIVSGLKLWPLAHCVTYGFIPKENRLLWVDMVEILWVSILATQAAAGKESSADSQVETTSAAAAAGEKR